MRGFLTFAGVVLLVATTASGGNIVRVTSPYFSFLISEPEDWTLDLESASQIAQFVLTPQGISWRSSNLVIFGRFVPAGPSENMESFLKADSEQFAQGCKTGKVRDLDWELEGAQKFQVRSYICPGLQDDIVAVTQLPRFFAVFILSAQLGGDIADGQEPFKEVLSGFRWLGRTDPALRRD